MTYKIKYSYKTGDSFKSWDESGILEMEWKKLSNAKAALKHIKEHYDWYRDQANSWRRLGDEPIAEPEWHTSKYESVINLVLDNGNEVSFAAPWCGYFERLHTAEIVSDNDDMRIDFD